MPPADFEAAQLAFASFLTETNKTYLESADDLTNRLIIMAFDFERAWRVTLSTADNRERLEALTKLISDHLDALATRFQERVESRFSKENGPANSESEETLVLKSTSLARVSETLVRLIEDTHTQR